VFDMPQHLVNGTTVLATDKQVILQAQGLAVMPAPEMQLTDAAGVAYVVINAEPLAPAGIAVIHTLQVRA
jgi:hypothetical protein